MSEDGKKMYDKIGNIYLECQGLYYDWVFSNDPRPSQDIYRQLKKKEKEMFDLIYQLCMRKDGKIYVR